MEGDERERTGERCGKDVRTSWCHLKRPPNKKFIGIIREKFRGEITENTTLADTQSKMISRWTGANGLRDVLWGTGRGEGKAEDNELIKKLHLGKVH